MEIRHRTLPPQFRFQADIPLATHWEDARCEEVDCPHYLMGWKTILDEGNALHEKAAEYIRSGATGLHFTEIKELKGLTTFIFPPEQQCFRKHKQQTGRPPILTSGERTHARGRDWNEDMNESFDRLRRFKERG